MITYLILSNIFLLIVLFLVLMKIKLINISLKHQDELVKIILNQYFKSTFIGGHFIYWIKFNNSYLCYSDSCWYLSGTPPIPDTPPK